MKFLLLVTIIAILATANASPRIIQGYPATAEQLPWTAAIYYSTSSLNSFCGGALVHPRWVLTAAHCVYEANSFTIYLGTTSLDTVDAHRVIVTATRSLVHPDYTVTSPYENDAGLIDLEVIIPLSEYIQTIELDWKFVQPGTPSLAAGWGTIKENDNELNPNLHYAEIIAISNNDCLLYYGNIINYKLVCASGLGQNICRGDTGGALVTYEPDGSPRHAGVATFASCESPYPSAFLRSHLIKRWVEVTVGIVNETTTA